MQEIDVKIGDLIIDYAFGELHGVGIVTENFYDYIKIKFCIINRELEFINIRVFHKEFKKYLTKNEQNCIFFKVLKQKQLL